MSQGKRARTEAPDLPCIAVEPPGRAQLLVVKPELQVWLGKKYCDDSELLSLLLAHSVVRRVRTIAVEVRPLGGDSFRVTLDTSNPTVGEAKSEISRVQGTKESRQELYKVATRADGSAVREDDADPESLEDVHIILLDGEVVAMAVKAAFDPSHLREECSLKGRTSVYSLVVHGDKLLSSCDQTIKVWNTET
jgi:hypothetical protein